MAGITHPSATHTHQAPARRKRSRGSCTPRLPALPHDHEGFGTRGGTRSFMIMKLPRPRRTLQLRGAAAQLGGGGGAAVAQELLAAPGLLVFADGGGGLAQCVQRAQEAAVGLVLPG